MPDPTDPVLRNARREALIILVVWLACAAYCCGYSYIFGYRREGRMLGVADIQPIWGIPSWVFWGYLLPWVVSGLFTFVFAGFFMADDDLGQDHAEKLEADIREGGPHG